MSGRVRGSTVVRSATGLVLVGSLLVAFGSPAGAVPLVGQIGVATYDGPASAYDQAVDIAVSPDGSKIYVTGQSAGTTTNDDYATVAYNGSTGNQIWVARYDGPAHG